ncbi:hypothetical protein GWI33_016457 [Rhynchophorus ferrugineus]|uniref:Uncharacterized protein n=1 Tax=Rhynchophorus ferrugineus TaxID=354439 RepID=A0A834I3H7_RHYFE|nr:hypothetical protein GWI33_016457 [Rhynchophorus ferrugineus]
MIGLEENGTLSLMCVPSGPSASTIDHFLVVGSLSPQRLAEDTRASPPCPCRLLRHWLKFNERPNEVVASLTTHWYVLRLLVSRPSAVFGGVPLT